MSRSRREQAGRQARKAPRRPAAGEIEAGDDTRHAALQRRAERARVERSDGRKRSCAGWKRHARPRAAGSPLPDRPRPRSAWRSTDGGRTARPRNGRRRPPSSTSCAGARWRRTRPRAWPTALGCSLTGRLEQRSWETPDGDRRSKVEVVADEVGPSLRWATAQVTKNDRRGPGDGARGGGRGQPSQASAPQAGYGHDEEPF